MKALRKALRFNQTGDLNHLFFEERALPILQKDEVIVAVKAARLNKNDLSNVMGRLPYTTVPRTPGRDYAGVISHGPETLIGQEVWGTGNENGFIQDGSHAEFIKIHVNAVAIKPKCLSFAQAANCGTPYMTAWAAIEGFQIKPNTTLLVIGAGGAVGNAAIEIAKKRGVRIIAAVKSPSQMIDLEQQGLTCLLLEKVPSEVGILKKILQEKITTPVDYIFDTTGFWIAPSVAAIGPFGRIAVIVAPGNGEVALSIRDLYRKGASLLGVNSLLYNAEQSAVVLTQLAKDFDQQHIFPPKDITTHAFSDAIQVYQQLSQGLSGKHVFVMDT